MGGEAAEVKVTADLVAFDVCVFDAAECDLDAVFATAFGQAGVGQA